MAGKKGFKYLIILLLTFAGMETMVAQESARDKVYQALIYDRMHEWDEVIVEMNSRKSSLSDKELGELVKYYYGYTGWLMEEGPKKKAKAYVAEADALIDAMLVKYPGESDLYAFKGAFFAYKISLNPVKAPFLGGQSMDNIDRAVELGPERPQAWIEKGNALFYMPRAFGGSKEKAVKAYAKAISFMEEDSISLHNDWMYLNVLLILAQGYEKTGNYDLAKSTYDKLLYVEPRFSYVRDEAYPDFMKSYEEQHSSGN